MLRFAPRPAKVYQGPPRSDEILYVSHVLFNVYNVLDVPSGFLWMERARWGGKEHADLCSRDMKGMVNQIGNTDIIVS